MASNCRIVHPIQDTFTQTITNGGCYVTAKRRSTKRKEFLENWDLYLNFTQIFTCHPDELPPNDPNGEDGMYSFVCLENGIKMPTREWNLVKRVQEGKMSVNLQMKLWSQDVGYLLMPNELWTYCKNYPLWVFQGTMEQSKKRILKEVGFIPTFMRVGDFP